MKGGISRQSPVIRWRVNPCQSDLPFRYKRGESGRPRKETAVKKEQILQMKKLISIIFIFVFSFAVFGQKTVADLKPSHAIALERFLSKTKDYFFLSENMTDDKDIKYSRKWLLGKNRKPYYITGDFNRDGVMDFALILSDISTSTKGGPVREEEEEKYREYPLAVVIFNGIKGGGFRQSFIQKVEATYGCYLSLDEDKKKRLYFAVFETDNQTMTFTPVGKGYITEFDL
jgi:hypothetical protein